MAKTKVTNGGPKRKAAKRKSNGGIVLASPLPAQTPERALFAAEVDDVFRRVGTLIHRAAELGISRQGFEATGPHKDELSRDVAAGLFVAWRTLQATAAFAQHGGELWSNFRGEVHKARNVFRGGRPDASPSADRSIAVAMAKQALGYAFGIGFQGRTSADAVRFLRETYSANHGEVFRNTPDDVIRVHLGEKSPMGRALTEWRSGKTSRDALDKELDRAALTLTRDVVWWAHAAVGAHPGESTFRFPMDPKDTTRAKLLARFQGTARDLKKRVRSA
jgi:hypothetical protein